MKRTVFGKFKRADDREIHVFQVQIEGTRYGSVREYIPSTKTYGRGIVIPVDIVNDVAGCLARLALEVRP